MKLRSLLAAGAALLLAAGATGASAQAPQAAAQQQDKAAALADLIAGPAIMLPFEMTLSKTGFYAGFESEGEEVLKEHPGLVDTLWGAIEPEVRRNALQNNAALVAEIAALYRERLTSKELDGVHGFYASATGSKVLRSMFEGIGSAPDAETPERKGPDLGPEDEAALKALESSIEIGKFQKVGDEVQQLTFAHWAKDDPEFTARIDAIVQKEIEKHLDSQDTAG